VEEEFKIYREQSKINISVSTEDNTSSQTPIESPPNEEE
jgi:hypothetical protein